MRDELRKGLRAARPFLLSHHEPDQYDRCHRVTLFGRDVHLCARCSGLYPGLVLAVVAPLPAVTVPLLVALPLPALLDWTLTAFTDRDGSNSLRTTTGLLLGYGYGLGLRRLLVGGDLRVLVVGAVYGVVVVALLALERHRSG